MLEGAIGQMKAILRGSEDNAIATFNASHRAIKDAIKRAVGARAGADRAAPPRPRARAPGAVDALWRFLQPGVRHLRRAARASAASLEDLLARETFFKELPAIEQHTKAIETEYARRFDEALDARVAAYTKAFDELVKTPGWARDRRGPAAPPRRARSSAGKKRDAERVPIPQLRADRDACDGRLRAAIAELRRIIDGERVVTVSVGSYFAGGIETEEQLDAALDGVREECARLIGAGKKVIVQ